MHRNKRRNTVRADHVKAGDRVKIGQHEGPVSSITMEGISNPEDTTTCFRVLRVMAVPRPRNIVVYDSAKVQLTS
jgi:hypothetical protein